MFDNFDFNKIRKLFPSLGALLLAVLVVGASQSFKVESLENLTVHVRQSLEPFDALTLGRTFYSEWTGCEVQGRKVVCKGDSSDTDLTRCMMQGREMVCRRGEEFVRCTIQGREMVCPGPSGSEIRTPIRGDDREPGITGWFGHLWTAIVNTAREVGSKSTWLGIAIYLTALVGGGVWLARKLDLAESGPAGGLAWVVLLPALASLVTLGLKWLLLLLTYAFSGVLSGLMFLAGLLSGSVIAVAKFAISVINTGHKLDSLAEQDAATNLPSSDQPRK